MSEFPVMKGNARVARGAGEFEVPLFSFIKKFGRGELWTGCSPAEFPDHGSLSAQDQLKAFFGEPVSKPASCKWLYAESYDAETGEPGPPVPRFDSILNLYPWGQYNVPYGVDQVTVEMYDSDTISDEVDRLARMVNEWLDAGRTVLVHCQAGLNRSALVAARALMLRGMTADEAIGLLRERRSPTVLCNEAFVDHLKGLE